MPQVTVNLTVEDLARIISNMSKEDLETLSTMLTDDGKELLKRKEDIETGRVKTLSKDEIFDV